MIMVSDLIDQVLEQCLWVYTFTEDNRKNIYYEKNTGRIINKNNERISNNTSLSSFPMDTSDNDIYETYLNNLNISKEKAYINCDKSGVLVSHTLIKQRYWKLSKKINDLLVKTHPELLI